MRMNEEVIGSTPLEFEIKNIPFTRPDVTVTLPEHRIVRVDLRKDKKPLKRLWELVTFRWRRALAQVLNEEHHVIMVPNHQGAGSWDAEDVPN